MQQTAGHGSPDSLTSVTCAQHKCSLTWTPMSGVLWQRPARLHSATSTEIAPSRRRRGIRLHQRQKDAQGWHTGGHFVGRWQHSSCSLCTKEQIVVLLPERKGREKWSAEPSHNRIRLTNCHSFPPVVPFTAVNVYMLQVKYWRCNWLGGTEDINNTKNH